MTILTRQIVTDTESPLLNLSIEIARLHQAERAPWCGHELIEALEVARGVCHGCFVREALELAAREVSK